MLQASHYVNYFVNITALMWHLSIIFNPSYILYKEHLNGKYKANEVSKLLSTLSITHSLIA